MDRWAVIRDSLDLQERKIIAAALEEFDSADRWDEFDYDTMRHLMRKFRETTERKK